MNQSRVSFLKIKLLGQCGAWVHRWGLKSVYYRKRGEDGDHMREKDLTHVVAAMGGYSWSLKVDGRDGATCRPVPTSLDAEEAEAACLASDHRE